MLKYKKVDIPSRKPESYTSKNTEPKPRVGFLRRAGRRVLETLFPYTVTEYSHTDASRYETSFSLNRHAQEPLPEDTTPSPIDLDIETSPSKVIALSRDKERIYTFDKTNPTPEAIEFRHNAERLFTRFAKMYFANGKGSFASEIVAERSKYQHSSVIEAAGKLSEVFPQEVFRYTYLSSGKLRLHFGDVALATMIATANLAEATDGASAAQKRHEQLIQEIDKDKIDLTFLDHAIIQNGKQSYYMPLQTVEALLAARTVEALENMSESRASSEAIAILTWSKMTVSERELFCASANAALAPLGPNQFEASVLATLRRLTHKLMATLEPKSDRFTILNDELKITYSDKPITQKFIQENPNLKPVTPSSGKEIDNLSIGERNQYIETAKLYTSQVKRRVPLEDDAAIAMLNFVMSPAGRWAINEISGTRDGYAKSATALRVMHKYLRRRLRSGYSSAHKNRQISGNRIINNPDRIRLVGGQLSEKSQWRLGRNMDEILDHEAKLEKDETS